MCVCVCGDQLQTTCYWYCSISGKSIGHLPAITPHMLAVIYYSLPIALSTVMCGNLFPPSMPPPPHHTHTHTKHSLVFWLLFMSLSPVLVFWKEKSMRYLYQLWEMAEKVNTSNNFGVIFLLQGFLFLNSYLSESAGATLPFSNSVLFHRPADFRSM